MSDVLARLDKLGAGLHGLGVAVTALVARADASSSYKRWKIEENKGSFYVSNGQEATSTCKSMAECKAWVDRKVAAARGDAARADAVDHTSLASQAEANANKNRAVGRGQPGSLHTTAYKDWMIAAKFHKRAKEAMDTKDYAYWAGEAAKAWDAAASISARAFNEEPNGPPRSTPQARWDSASMSIADICSALNRNGFNLKPEAVKSATSMGMDGEGRERYKLRFKDHEHTGEVTVFDRGGVKKASLIT